MASAESATEDQNAVRELDAWISAARLTDDEQSDLYFHQGRRSESFTSTSTVSPRRSPVEERIEDENQMASRFDRIKALLSLNPFSNTDKRGSSSFIGGPAQHAFPRHLLVTVSQDHIRRELDSLEAKVQQQFKNHLEEARDTQQSFEESKNQVKRLEQSVEGFRISLRKAQEDIAKAERARRGADENTTRLEIQSFEKERAHQEELAAVRSGHQGRIHDLNKQMDTLLSAHRTDFESVKLEQQRQREDNDSRIEDKASAHNMDIERLKGEHHRQMGEARGLEDKLRSENTQQADTIHKLENIVRSRKESVEWLRISRQALLDEMESLRAHIETSNATHLEMVQSLKTEHEEAMCNIQRTLSSAKDDQNVAEGDLQKRLVALQARLVKDQESFVDERDALEHQIAELRSKHDRDISAALTSHESDTHDLESRFQALRSDGTLEKRGGETRD